ncbi:hypothetical protein D9M68_445830 [compost metagenome]
MITYRTCAWCRRTDMECRRASKRLCSNKCQAYFHRERQKLGITITEMFERLENQHNQEDNTIMP